MKFLSQLISIKLLHPTAILHMFISWIFCRRNQYFILFYAAKRWPNKIAVSDCTQKLTYRELANKSAEYAALLKHKYRLTASQTVAFLFENTSESIAVFFALQQLGVPLILCHFDISGNAILSLKKRHKELVVIGKNKNIEPGRLADTESGEMRLKTISRTASNIWYQTSGSTGSPKLVAGRSGVLYWLKPFADLIATTGIMTCKNLLLPIPLSSAYGFTTMLFCFFLGKKLSIVSGVKNVGQLFLPDKLPVDCVAGVPSALFSIAGQLPSNHHVKIVISGGAPLTVNHLNALHQKCIDHVYGLYGSTEASTSFIATPEHLRQNVTALGRPLAGIRYRIDENGELQIHSGLANVSENWYRTGDICALHDSGMVTWIGRKDRMIIRNGYNIYPEPIETLLMEFPGISNALVIALPNDLTGSEIVAFAETVSVADTGDIWKIMSEHFDKHLLPDCLNLIHEIPILPSGKPDIQSLLQTELVSRGMVTPAAG